MRLVSTAAFLFGRFKSGFSSADLQCVGGGVAVAVVVGVAGVVGGGVAGVVVGGVVGVAVLW